MTIPTPYNKKANPVFLVNQADGVAYTSAGAVLTDIAATIADGADVAEGAVADTAVTSPSSSGSVIALLKGLLTYTSWLYNHITTSTTTTISGAHVLHSVSVNTKGTIASTTTIKDGSTTLAVIDSLNLSGTWVYDIACATSIVIVTTGTSAPDVTVSYR